MYMCSGKIELKDGKQRRVDVCVVFKKREKIQEIEGSTSSANGLQNWLDLAFSC